MKLPRYEAVHVTPDYPSAQNVSHRCVCGSFTPLQKSARQVLTMEKLAPLKLQFSKVLQVQISLLRALASIGLESTPCAFQNVLFHFSSSIRTWVIGQNVWSMSSLEFIVDCSHGTTEMLIMWIWQYPQICQDPKVKEITWLSAQLAKSLIQMTCCHLHECHFTL